MYLDPIYGFSYCQAYFYQRTDLAIKIYALTWSSLIGATSYFAASAKSFPFKNIEPIKAGVGMAAAAWLIASTFAGYIDRPK